jgi:glucose-6-phosphate-specific signal transduction histidine kinase
MLKQIKSISRSRKGSRLMARSFSGRNKKDAAVFRPGPLRRVPRVVQVSFVLWLIAVGAGVLETLIRIIYSSAGGPESNGLLVRAVVYVVAVYVIAQMRRGKRWARITLAVLLGGTGTLSLVIDPISWLAGGNSLRDVFAQADILFVLVAPIRAVHLAAVVTALVFMFLPAANDYFRREKIGTATHAS